MKKEIWINPGFSQETCWNKQRDHLYLQVKGPAQGNESRLQKQMSIVGASEDLPGAKEELLHGSRKSGPMSLPTEW